MNDTRLITGRGLSVEEQGAYEYILSHFATGPGNRKNPVDFLRKLSPDGIDLLKKAQSLPANARIDLDRANTEGALNLILPHSQQADLNNDGFNEGITGGYLWRFPPTNAPQEVKDAWEKATDGLSEGDRLTFQAVFMIDMVGANLKRDADGTPIGVYGPLDPEFRNPFADPQFDYGANADWHMLKLEKERHLISGEQYAWQKAMLTRWMDALADMDTALVATATEGES